MSINNIYFHREIRKKNIWILVMNGAMPLSDAINIPFSNDTVQMVALGKALDSLSHYNVTSGWLCENPTFTPHDQTSRDQTS